MVDPRPRPKVIECYRLEADALSVVAEGARSGRDDLDAFRTVVMEDIISNGVSGGRTDCVDSTGGGNTGVVLVGHPDLAGIGPPEASRNYSWSFKFEALPV